MTSVSIIELIRATSCWGVNELIKCPNTSVAFNEIYHCASYFSADLHLLSHFSVSHIVPPQVIINTSQLFRIKA